MISIVVPVYNVEPYLRQCVDSILKQTYSDIEVILIDDGSPDNCGALCDEYSRIDSRVRVYHTANHGLSAARNLGIRMAQGEYIGFVDSDDWIEADMFMILLNKIRETNANVCVCGYDMIPSSEYFEPKESVYMGDDSLFALLKGDIKNCAWNKLYRTDLFKKTDGAYGILFPEGRHYEDIFIMHELIREAGTIATVPILLYHYLIRSNSISKTPSAKIIMDYADAYIAQYYYVMQEAKSLNLSCDDTVRIAARGIVHVWLRWHQVNSKERKEYKRKINELKEFSKRNIPLLGYRSWPFYLRFSSFFTHSSRWISFASLHCLRRLFKVIGGCKE